MKSSMTRILALAVCLLLLISGNTFASAYSDITEQGDPELYRIVDTLSGMKVITGYPDGTFQPDRIVSRAEFAVILTRLFGQEDNIDSYRNVILQFSDIDDHWAKAYIEYAAGYSIVNGMGDGTFNPDCTVTYAQVLKMLVCALGYGSYALQNGGWPHGYLQAASDLGLTELVSIIDMSQPCPRKDVVLMVVKAYDVNLTYSGTDGFISVIDDELGHRPNYLLDYVLKKYPDLNFVDYRDFQPSYIDTGDTAGS